MSGLKRRLSLVMVLILCLSPLSKARTGINLRPQQTPEEFAARLLTISDDSERAALLKANGGLVTNELRKDLSQRARRLRNLAKYPEALIAYNATRHVAELMGDHSGIADALDGIGTTELSLGQPALALKIFQASLELAQQWNDKAVSAKALYNIGLVNNRQENYAA